VTLRQPISFDRGRSLRHGCDIRSAGDASARKLRSGRWTSAGSPQQRRSRALKSVRLWRLFVAPPTASYSLPPFGGRGNLIRGDAADHHGSSLLVIRGVGSAHITATRQVLGRGIAAWKLRGEAQGTAMPRNVTLLELVNAVAERTRSEAELTATVALHGEPRSRPPVRELQGPALRFVYLDPTLTRDGDCHDGCRVCGEPTRVAGDSATRRHHLRATASHRANTTHWSATPARNIGPARRAATVEATHGIVLDDQPRVVVRYTTLPALVVSWFGRARPRRTTT
jgi:hypothetical protein